MQDVVRVVVALEPRQLALEVIDFLDRSGRVRVVAAAEDADALVREVRRARPAAVVAGPGMIGDAGGAEALGPANVFAVAPEETLSVLKRSFEVGAKAFFRWPGERDALVESASRAGLASERPSSEPGRVVAVLGPRGGAGTTFLATHLAAVTARRGIGTAYVDANHLFADGSVALGVPVEDPPRTLADLLPIVDELAEEQLAASMWRHPAGFSALLAPSVASMPPTVSATQMRRAIALVAARTQVVVVEVPRSLDALARAALESADRIVLVLTLDLLAFASARRALDLLGSLGLAGRCVLVVNRARRASLVPRDVEVAFGAKAAAVIGEDRSVGRLQELGKLLPMRGATFRRIDGLARTLLAELGLEPAVEPVGSKRGRGKSVPAPAEEVAA
jgi:pilus assembly protein CpaE